MLYFNIIKLHCNGKHILKLQKNASYYYWITWGLCENEMLKYIIYTALFEIFYLLIKNYHETNYAIAFQSYLWILHSSSMKDFLLLSQANNSVLHFKSNKNQSKLPNNNRKGRR